MAKKSFEDALHKLEEITRELEDGDLSLEKSLNKFDEGVKLAEYCNQKLEEAQKKVDILLHKNGELTSVPFDSNFNSESDSTD
ncbi:MAG: exodeoxyribonuclease VII small subunit [Desulfobulbaceae bacterium]|nr:exodeoxyribonuclease VII small subunit [Desulfobulbaceae bacterium]HIJ77858.1 exodeoxyribonuclease VII small subunit [Deltaproteobacteria bacterium]